MPDGWIHGSAELAGMVFPLKVSADDYVLGSACPRGHQWPGSVLTLRRADRRAPGCRACTSGRHGSPWWLPFVDWSVAPVPEGKKLGKLCRNGHDWNSTGLSLRIRGEKSSHCVECLRVQWTSPEYKSRRQEKDRRYSERHAEEIRERDRQRQLTPSRLAAKRASAARMRAARQAAGLTTAGTVRAVPLDQRERSPLNRWLRSPRLSPSVMELVENERRQHWRECPEDGREARRVAAAHAQWLRYQTCPDVRLAHREKSKRRKAQIRRAHVCKVDAMQIRSRFRAFGSCCAYCGGQGTDLHMDHFVPLAKGGTHVLGNLLPACPTCNFGKRDHDPESWYRAQPFFTETRWRKICQVLGLKKHRGAAVVGQLTLI